MFVRRLLDTGVTVCAGVYVLSCRRMIYTSLLIKTPSARGRAIDDSALQGKIPSGVRHSSMFTMLTLRQHIAFRAASLIVSHVAQRNTSSTLAQSSLTSMPPASILSAFMCSHQVAIGLLSLVLGVGLVPGLGLCYTLPLRC